MIIIKDYEKNLKKLGNQYFIHELHEVPDISVWAEEHDVTLAEPHLPMKLIVKEDEELSMMVQSEMSEEVLSDVVKNLSVRWTVRDNTVDMEMKLNSPKKRLAYCFLKEYARALQKFEGDELLEDEWVIEEMEYLGYFDE